MSAQRRLDEPAGDEGAVFVTPPASADPASAPDSAIDSPARLLQARLMAAYSPHPGGFALDTNLPPLVRLAVLLGSACGLWVCLGGLAFLILR